MTMTTTMSGSLCEGIKDEGHDAADCARRFCPSVVGSFHSSVNQWLMSPIGLRTHGATPPPFCSRRHSGDMTVMIANCCRCRRHWTGLD